MLTNFVSFAQHTYLLEYKASFTTSSLQPAWGNSIFYMDGGTERLIYNVTSNTNSASVDTFYLFSTTSPITQLKARTVSVSGTLTSCISGASDSALQSFNGCTMDSSFITEAVSGNRCVSGSVTKFNLIKIDDFQTVNNFSATNNEIKSCEPRVLQMPTNCRYALEYKIPSNASWVELLTYGNNPSSVSVNQSDFIGLNTGQNVQLRIRYSDTFGETNSNVYSNILTYNIVGCSPEFHSINKTDTTCNYTTDGSFKLNVKRNLNSGEELVITLYDATNNALVGQEFTTSLINNGGGNYGYLWTGNLDGGTYSVKFQSHNGSGGINPNDSSWSSLNSVGTFEVKKAESVSFSVTNKSDENCFNEKDGYIEVSATREGSRTLLYQLSNNGIVQIFNGINWGNYTGSDPENETFYPFTNNDETIISKLGKGVYRIKVRDSEKCYMK